MSRAKHIMESNASNSEDEDTDATEKNHKPAKPSSTRNQSNDIKVTDDQPTVNPRRTKPSSNSAADKKTTKRSKPNQLEPTEKEDSKPKRLTKRIKSNQPEPTAKEDSQSKPHSFSSSSSRRIGGLQTSSTSFPPISISSPSLEIPIQSNPSMVKEHRMEERKESIHTNDTPKSVFVSTETIEQRYKHDPQLVEQVNRYDQLNESFLCRNWLSKSELEWRNNKWNPIGSAFVIFYYVQKILKWPMEEARVVVQYSTNAIKFETVIEQIYKLYKIEHHWNDSSILVKFLVWSIASMNSFGIIRPIVFKAISNKCFRLEQLCVSQQNHNRVTYFITWPFRVDNQKVYVIRDRSRLHEFSLKTTIMSDLHLDSAKSKKLLKEIPEWVYGLVKQ